MERLVLELIDCETGTRKNYAAARPSGSSKWILTAPSSGADPLEVGHQRQPRSTHPALRAVPRPL